MLGALNRGFELWREFLLIFKNRVQPITNARELGLGEFLQLRGKLLNLAHARSMIERRPISSSRKLSNVGGLPAVAVGSRWLFPDVRHEGGFDVRRFVHQEQNRPPGRLSAGRSQLIKTERARLR